ncbi:hypothetical protein [Clostridium sp.]|nr:hypothetical protein [Clostridium sp.]
MEAGIYDSNSFGKRVKVFCKECLNKQYYIESEYNYYYGKEGHS